MATARERKAADPSVASDDANAELEHTVGGSTTRDDALDLGVPMKPAETGPEYLGPEDALGTEPTRGDYSLRIGPSNYHPHEVLRSDDGVKVDPQRERPAAQA
jgi:hypothetical protein